MVSNEMLVKKAYEAQKFAYTPYSQFRVGAALLAKNGTIYLGCNIENAAYSPTNCAERTAFFKAVSEGVTEFEAIAIVGNTKDAAEEQKEYCAPCGVCRQVMAEFCDPKTFRVILGKSETDFVEYKLEEVLPFGFTKEDMRR
ncbi:cytidine deaminase [Lachnospiraceae bacterium KM106-2]|nr:cytidine deaminase [Lachnospiraceae bacterium KM106-2]